MCVVYSVNTRVYIASTLNLISTPTICIRTHACICVSNTNTVTHDGDQTRPHARVGASERRNKNATITRTSGHEPQGRA